MNPLQEKNSALLEALAKTGVPAVRQLKIMCYLRDAREDGQLSLYEEYLLMAEALAYERQSYLLPAWSRKVRISHLLALLNMRMMALLFRDEQGARVWEAWGMEAYGRNQEQRSHVILEQYPAFLHAEQDPALLQKLLEIRNRRSKPFEQGPYHSECYPYENCAYEERLLQGRYFSEEEKQISGDIAALLVDLCLLQDE